MRQILPSAVAVAETQTDVALTLAWPEETAAITSAAPARQAEYVTVRHCARAGLAELGVAPSAIVNDDRGAPVWPAGLVGSLTHRRAFRAAAVARRGSILSIGIDAEPAETLGQALLARISTSDELARIQALAAADPAVPWGRLLFSIKESIYKAWFPLTRVGLGFDEVDVEPRPDGSATVGFRRRLPGVAQFDWRGSWTIADGYVQTAVVVSGGS